MLKKTLLGLALWLTGMAQAQMSETLKSKFHKDEEIGAIIVGQQEKANLPALLADPKVRVIALQLLKGEFDESQVGPMLEWVRSGRSLWFYDVRLAPLFGFAPVMLKSNQFTNKPESGNLGGLAVEGLATTGMAMGGHPVLEGVNSVTAFLPRLNQDDFGAVNITADIVPLLRFTANSPAISALRREGRGLIVYKTLLWSEALSSDRFQANLLEFSAGFPVPRIGGEGTVGRPPGPEADYIQARPLATPPEVAPAAQANQVNPQPDPAAAPVLVGDEIEVVGEGMLQGRSLDEKLRFETGTSTVQLTRLEVESLEINSGGQLDVVHWRDGHLSKGFLMDKNLEFDVNGDSRRIAKKLVRRLRWGKIS